MSEISETINSATSSMTANNNAAIGELQNIQTAYRLNGKNYLKWSQFIRTYLKGKGKLSHLQGAGPQEGDQNLLRGMKQIP